MEAKTREMIEELKRLMAKATSRPWFYNAVEDEPEDGIGEYVADIFTKIDPSKIGGVENAVHTLFTADWGEEEDAALIVGAVNLLPTLIEEVEKGYERGLRDSVKAQCMFCGDRYKDFDNGRYKPFEAGVDVEPIFLPRQYVPNQGEMEGFVHRSVEAGYIECAADAMRRRLIPPATASEDVGEVK